jgi:hypothetical protein
MKFTFNPGLSLFLVILFAFQPVALCATVPRDCPHLPESRLGADCCFVSAAPVSPVPRNPVQPALYIAPDTPFQAVRKVAQPGIVVHTDPPIRPPKRSVLFRQLLI